MQATSTHHLRSQRNVARGVVRPPAQYVGYILTASCLNDMTAALFPRAFPSPQTRRPCSILSQTSASANHSSTAARTYIDYSAPTSNISASPNLPSLLPSSHIDTLMMGYVHRCDDDVMMGMMKEVSASSSSFETRLNGLGSRCSGSLGQPVIIVAGVLGG